MLHPSPIYKKLLCFVLTDALHLLQDHWGRLYMLEWNLRKFRLIPCCQYTQIPIILAMPSLNLYKMCPPTPLNMLLSDLGGSNT